MAGDAGGIMLSEGMGGMSPFGETSQQSQTSPQEQARGAVQLISSMRKQTGESLTALATQFPAVSKNAHELQQVFEQALQRLLREIVSSANQPEPSAPAVLR